MTARAPAVMPAAFKVMRRARLKPSLVMTKGPQDQRASPFTEKDQGRASQTSARKLLTARSLL